MYCAVGGTIPRGDKSKSKPGTWEGIMWFASFLGVTFAVKKFNISIIHLLNERLLE